MEGCGVIVQYSQLVDGANEELSCSGMYLGHGIVLTHGTLLLDLLKNKKAQPIIEQLSKRGNCVRTRQEANFLNSIFTDVQASFKVILPSKEHVPSGIKCYTQCQTSIRDENKSFVAHTESSGFLSAAAQFDRVILQPGVSECLGSLVPASQGWKLLEEDQSYISPALEKLILSTFVLLTLSGSYWIKGEPDSIVIKAARQMMSLFIPTHKGDFVYVESSPFGLASPSIFLNSLSRGIICNTGPKGHEVLLTDARCITGSEGAPVFVVKNGHRRPCAIVISPFCWRRGEWLGLTLLASLGPVLHSLLQSCGSSTLSLPKNLAKNHHCTSSTTPSDPQSRNGTTDTNFLKEPLKDISNSVVCIQSNGDWGSGLVISTSPGVILTCAHVTYKAINKEVTVLLSDGRRTRGTVIHQTKPLITCRESARPPSGYSLWDLAVVLTSSPLSHALPLATSLPPQGVNVVVAGYGIFPYQVLPTATLSSGVISRVVSVPSLSLNLPPSLTKGKSRERDTPTESDGDNSLGLDDTSTGNAVTNQHNFPVMRDPKSSDDSSHCLMKLERFPSGSSSKNIPVPVVMQTTCAVYAGGSGGPVVTVHPSHGLQAVGLVVCNMQDSNSITFPHVNLAIPIPAIATILKTFLKTGDETVLKYLDIECAATSHLWGLTHSLRSCM